MAIVGTLALNLSRTRHFVVTGGPFEECPADYRGVKMAAEIRPLPQMAIDLPTEDYRTPPVEAAQKALGQAVDLILQGHPLYVGCMAGRGRTGLFLSLLSKAFGVKQPVEYVRANYYSHAVETDGQYAYVTNFPIPFGVKLKIRKAKFTAFVRALATWDRSVKSLTRIPQVVTKARKRAAPRVKDLFPPKG